MIDNYDSFTYNLVQYFAELGEEVKVFRNDEISVEEQLSTIDESTLIESLTAESTEDETKSPAEEQSIENYLLDNNIDESSLTKM